MSSLYLLDTCVISNVMKPSAPELYPALVARYERIQGAQGCYLSVVTSFEIRRGLERAARAGLAVRHRAGIEHFLAAARFFDLGGANDPAWRFASDVWATGRSRRPTVSLPTLEDLLIVATAYANDFVLLTTDEKLCERLTELGFGGVAELVPVA